MRLRSILTAIRAMTASVDRIASGWLTIRTDGFWGTTEPGTDSLCKRAEHSEADECEYGFFERVIIGGPW